MAKVFPTQKFGYIDIKQSSKVRPRKLKSWKRRWAVLTQMSNLSSEEYVAKLDLYDNDTKWRTNSSDKMTLVLENVTCIRPVGSRTHQHAFEVIEDHPVLVVSGATELESYSWILSLQQIFTPEQIEAKKDCYQVTISANEHSDRWSLSGDYNLTVCSTCISLARTEGASIISWGLNTLIKFNVKQSQAGGQMAVLIIECGPNAPTGESSFHFLSNEAQDILSAIRQSICLALALKQNTRNATTRPRTLSASISEKGFQKLLDSYTSPQSMLTNRSDSCSSGSTTFGSLPSTSRLSSSPVVPSVINRLSTDRGYLVEMNESIKARGFELTEESKQIEDVPASEKVVTSSHKRSSSQPDKCCICNHDYSEVRDTSEYQKPASRRITLACQPSDFDLDRLRSVSDVSASMKAGLDHSCWRSFKEETDDKSDLDSAISSLALSAANDDLPMTDALLDINPESNDVFQQAYLNQRRRSSSTPDLQAYRKMHENVYEELDELRDSVSRLNVKRDLDVPPELPARHFSANLKYATHLNPNSAAAEKRSILNWYRQVSYDDVKGNGTPLCTCEGLKDTRSPFESSGGHCISCGNKTPTGQANPNAKAPAKDALVNYSFSDINDIILQVQNMKRRRSSDITQVASSYLLSALIPDTASSRTSNQFYWEDPERFPNAQENLINIEEKEDIFDLGITASVPPSKSAQDNQSDPWIIFP